jgi:hypothetical protein
MTCQQKQMQSAAIAKNSTPRVRDWQAMPSAVEKPPMVGKVQFKVHDRAVKSLLNRSQYSTWTPL